jgi:hypothetical protein
MTPKEKAEELVNNTGKIIGKELKNGGFKYNFGIAKHCALLAVDEILFVLNECEDTYSENASQFYNEVKQEIEKL